VKVTTHRDRSQNLYATAKLLVERRHETLAFERANFCHHRQVHVDDLIEGVHASVGTTGTHDHWFLFESQCLGERGPKKSHDGVVLGLISEATKGLAVVGQVEAPPLRGA
jgi:hypothetical protein